MNRIEFMAGLEGLLQDISAEERQEALIYYQDYFDDAGAENEQKVISELGSPEKVAATIKADLKGQNDANSEYRESGYADTRFEEKATPAERGGKGPWTSKPLKIILIVLIACTIVPIVWPILLGIVGLLFGLLCASFGLFIGIVFGAAAIMIAGGVLFVAGLLKLMSAVPIGLLTSGMGLLLFVFGLIATVAAVRLCMIVYPGMIRAVVNICRIPFDKMRKAV